MQRGAYGRLGDVIPCIFHSFFIVRGIDNDYNRKVKEVNKANKLNLAISQANFPRYQVQCL